MSDPLSPKSPRKGGKQVSLRVCFLDDTVHAFQVPVKSLGHVLWEAVFNHLQLLESDYFDLEFTDAENLQCWIDREKPILKQLPMADTPLRFCVKFYTPDPGLLEDELTRYLFALQIKRDLLTGALPCSDNTAALLASYIVQAEIGDFLVDEYHDHTYLSSMKFVPQQTPDLLIKIMEYHKQHVGESPSEADLNLLDTARKVELYGIRMHAAKDHEGVLLNLAASHMGVLVFQNFTKINTFSWAKIRKLSFKRKKFLIKLHPENYHMQSEMVEHNRRALGIKGYYKDTVEFFFESRNECKGFWKKCIEHHAFFRCQTVKKLPRNKTRVVSRGSSFRYSGRTQKQLQEFVRDTVVKRPQFERSTSGRISSRSTSVTPKIHPKTSVHNSSDLHNSTASSGSHILEPLQDNHVDGGGMPTRLETAEVHSDSSMSGSRSLGSPKLDHSQMSHPSESRSRSTTQTPELPLSEPANAVSAATAIVAANADSSNQVFSMQQPYSPGGLKKNDQPYSPGGLKKNDQPYSPGGLKKNDRKLSAPVLGSMDVVAASVEEENRLSRCPEVENIPEVVQEDLESPTAVKRFSLTRSHSAAVSENMLVNSRHHSVTTPPSPPPPPPPPPFDENDLPPPPPPPPSYCLVMDGVPSTISSTSIGISNLSTLSAAITEEGEEESRKKKRHPVGSAYYIAKELLMTERTYKKDLEVVCIWFRNSIRGDEDMLHSMSELLFSVLDPIYEFHCQFVKEVDQRLSMWEGKSNAHLNGDYQRIGDILLNAVTNIQQMYETYLDRQEEILSDIDLRMKRDKKFEDCYKDFEGQKVCYLPLNTFILKPGHRLLHYKLILERLVKHYSEDHPDAADCRAALQKVSEVVKNNHDKMRRVENVQKLTEVQRDLVGIEGLVGPTREFIREGCLQKFSRKGYQQRMFFLFDDMLIYTSRTSSTLLLFKVHGQLPLKGMIVEEAEQTKVAVQNCFAIYAGNKYILCAASSPEEMSKWIEDINEAVIRLKSRPDDKFQYPSLKSSASSSENMDGIADGQEGERPSPPSPEKTIQHRANTTMHVCWHRNTSVSMRDHEKAVKNQLSGYLLRKFKNSNGWQKLWVVFTNFCLFFYKTYQDDFPLASLPLLGYAVSLPTEEDAIHKDHVFKLQFKNHVYFFRAESEYTFGRWMEVINCATSSARRTRLFSRMASEITSPAT